MTTQNQEPAAQAGAERQIVALHLGEQIYGVDIAAIHTVITPQAITAVPRTPAFVAGVMNLRGRIVPVVDLRKRFEMPPADGVTGQRIVIIEADGLTAGLIVDSVSEVLRMPQSAISPPTGLIATAESDCLLGIGRIPGEGEADERLILLLDVQKTLATTPDETETIHGLQRAA